MLGISVTPTERRAPTALNEWFSLGKNLVWVFGLVITGTVAFTTLSNRTNEQATTLKNLEDKMKESDIARSVNTDKIQTQLAEIRAQQTQLLVAIAKLEVALQKK